MSIPHPIPYQGSKRLLAAAILSHVKRPFARLVEPFAGSAAVSLAAAFDGRFSRFHINDSLEPLIGIWRYILDDPELLASQYSDIWHEQLGQSEAHYYEIRAKFNADKDPVKLLYLLARCVKNAVRFNQNGEFNQSPDRRRLGMRPTKMRAQVIAAHNLLAGKTDLSSNDYRDVLQSVTTRDLVYMDPPYQGTSIGRDRRYFQSLDLESFLDELEELNRRGVAYLLSFDGRCGDTKYGQELPPELQLQKVEIEVGRSAQATLNGRSSVTVESLYLSPALAPAKTKYITIRPKRLHHHQLTLFGDVSTSKA